MVDEFAIDDNTAEKAQLQARSSAHQNPPVREERAGNTENGVPMEQRSRDQDGLDFRHDAKIWHLYLVEAEREAKERAELWRTGLDAVLIFAGLFAGIVSAFVIDVRKDLEADSEQRLLANIDSILQGQRPNTKRIPAISIAMSGLWNISLYITLFAAMMGASAKAWLATFVPVNTPHEAKGAFHRYRLDQHAERWCLREVIAAAPLLVQLALFLFLIGLVLQNFADNWVLGSILLLFCVSGAILYVLMTVHPWTTPTSPFNTAASDPLLWIALGLPSRGKKNPPDVEEDINKGLAGILYGHLLKSPKPNLVDEAIAEIALPGFKQQWIDYLCRRDTARVVLTRLRQCVTTRPTASESEENKVCNILHVFLRFLEHYEVETQSPGYSRGENPAAVYKDFIDVMDQLSVLEEHNHSIVSLRDASEEVQTLFLGLRIHLDCRSPNVEPFSVLSTVQTRWPLCTHRGDSTMDLSPLKLAACRAIIKQHRRYMASSAQLLCASLASGPSGWGMLRFMQSQAPFIVAVNAQQTNASLTNYTSTLGKNTEEVYLATASNCLLKLYSAVQSGRQQTEWPGNSRTRSRPLRRGRGRGKFVTAATVIGDLEDFSEELFESVSLTVQRECPEVESTLKRLVKGRNDPGDVPKEVLLSVVQSLCSAIQNTCSEDHGPLILLLAFLHSKYRGLFESGEVLTALRDVLPEILDDITQSPDDATARVQSLVLDLLSAMTIIPESRKQIILYIIGISGNPQLGLQANVDLLIQLLLDERFADDPMDIVMLMFAPHMLPDLPHMDSYQARILDALSLRYGSKSLELDSLKHRELLEWFTMAVLGQHATAHEISNWVSRCQLWFAEV